jgi:hypothetical protein
MLKGNLLTFFRLLGKKFEPKTEKVLRERRRMHKEGLYELYCSSNIIRVIKSRRTRWTGHVARMADMKAGCKVSVEEPER